MTDKKKIIILADGGFNILEAKTAVGVIRYNKTYEIIAIIDSTNSGKKCCEVIGVGGNIPIVSSLEEGLLLDKNINTLFLGTAPKGGILPQSWREIIINGMKNKLDIINPLHKMFNEDEEFRNISIENNITIWDVRKVNMENRVADLSSHKVKANIILTVGTDCNVGKMSTAIEIDNKLNKNGLTSIFVPTGQTAILIAGWGTAIDRVIADFTAGASENLVLEASKKAPNENDYIIVEGQGSLVHPGYSGVNLSLLRGAGADALILCHQCIRKTIRRYTTPIPPLKEYINIHNILTKTVKYSPVIAISLNTYGLTNEEALIEIENTKLETGLPVTDPIRYGPDILIEAINNYFSKNKKIVN